MPSSPDRRYKMFYLAILSGLSSRVHTTTSTPAKVAEYAKALATEMNSRSTSSGSNNISDRDEIAAEAITAIIPRVHNVDFGLANMADKAFIVADAVLDVWLT